MAALLDVTVSGFRDRLARMTDADVASVDDSVDAYAGQYFDALTRATEGDPDAPQQVAQAIALMSDETLHTVVALFGDDPAPESARRPRRR